MTEPGKLWVGSIVVDCKNFDQMIAFWKAALGYELVRPPEPDWAILHDPHRRGPNLSFQRDPDGPGPVYWYHLDLYSSDPENEVARLLGLGATMRRPAEAGTDYVTLADPDDNPFDVVDARGYAHAQRAD